MDETKGLPELNAFLLSLPEKVVKNAERILNLEARALQKYIRIEKMTGGTTDTRLRVRSGRLRDSVIPIPAKITNTGVEAGVGIGNQADGTLRYARVHIGPAGQQTTIRPKKGKYLTIPLDAAMTPTGQLKAPATSDMWGETFVRKSKKGNLIIFGKVQVTKGKHAGEYRGDAVPLFLLRKEVTIKARIHPAELLDWIKPRMLEDFSSKKFKVTE